MQVQIYDVADIVGGGEDLTEGWLDDASPGRSRADNPQWGMGGMGAGGGMGGMGGGGMMRVPPHIQPQFGDGGGGMGGMGGGMGTGGGFGLAGLMPSNVPASRTPTLMQVVELIESMTAGGDTQWENRDGAGGAIQPVGDSILAIRHTAAVHQRIEAILAQLREELRPTPALIVELRLVKLSAEEAAEFEPRDAESIAARVEDPEAMRVHLRCVNHRVARVAAGLRRSYVVSAVPVVGAEAPVGGRDSQTGYQPVTMMPLIGLFGGVLPTLDDRDPAAPADAPRTATLNLGLVLASGPEETASMTYGSGLTVDRVELKVAKLSTQLRSEEDVWTTPGTVPLVEGIEHLTQGELLEHLAVFARWQVAE